MVIKSRKLPPRRITGMFVTGFLIIFALFLTGLIILSSGTPVTAATYYVSTSGSDSNLGTQISSWAHCPGMRGWTGSANLNPGDTVYFNNENTWTYVETSTVVTFLELKGGVTYNGRLWGSGSKATFNVSSIPVNNAIVSFYTDNPTYETVFDGFKITPTGNNTAISMNYPQTGSMTDMTGAKKRIQNLTVNGTNQVDVSDSYCILLGGYNGHHIDNVSISSNTVNGCIRDGIYLYTGNEDLDNLLMNVTVNNNEVYGNGRAPSSSGSGIKFKNRVHGATAEYNYVHDNIGGAVAFDSGPFTPDGPKNITIRNNIIVNATYSPDKWGAAVSFSSDHAGGMNCSAKIYDNIIWNPALPRGIYMTAYQAPNVCDVDINNNVIRSNGSAIYANSNLATIRINNNVLISKDSDSHVVLYDTATSITNHLSNIYYMMDGSTSLVKRGGTTYTTSNLGTWEPTAFSSNPNFKNSANIPTGFFANNTPNTDGLSILSGNAINNGTNLGYPFNISINNVIRGATWDIGAYEQ